MSMPRKLEKFLKKHKVYYQILVHPKTFTCCQTAEADHVPGGEVAKVVMVKARGKDMMAVVPSTRSIDLFKLSAALGTQDVRIEEEKEFQDLFPDCETGAMPPFGKLYHLRCFVDESLQEVPEIVFHAGNHSESIKISKEDFFRVTKAEFGDFSMPGRKLADQASEKIA